MQESGSKLLVFRRTQRGVDWLVRRLRERGVNAEGLHGSLSQSQRERTMQDFRDGKLTVLVATNVAARGLDINLVSDVLNYDVPQNAEEYSTGSGAPAAPARPAPRSRSWPSGTPSCSSRSAADSTATCASSTSSSTRAQTNGSLLPLSLVGAGKGEGGVRTIRSAQPHACTLILQRRAHLLSVPWPSRRV